jgi:butyrate kinase
MKNGKEKMKILALNPGSTSTKIGLYEDCELVFAKTIRHSADEIMKYPKIIDQYSFRRDVIIKTINEQGVDLSELDAVVGRGGLLKPIPGGVYRVNDALIADLKKEIMGEHASNLGAILANEIVMKSGKDIGAFIVDPVVVDELCDEARYSGRPELPRISIFHALNQKAVSRRYARENNKRYEDLNLIVVHLGGGITVGAHEKGRVVDVNNGLDGDGPFSPERTGSLPVGALAKLCFSGRFQLHEIRKMITGRGGIVAYLNTNDSMEVEKRIGEGDNEAKMIYQAMAYQIAKEIGKCATVLKGKVDAIILTGGLANSKMITDWVKERTSFISKVEVYPGEDELWALSEGVYFALNGEQEIKEYV